MIIEIVDIVFTILFDNSSSSSFPLPVFEERELGELVVVVAVNVAATVVVPAGGNGAADVVLPNDTGAADVVVVTATGDDVVITLFVVVLPNDVAVVVVGAAVVVVGAAVVVVGAAVVVVGAAVVVVWFNTQTRSDVRLPLNEMYSLLLHCFQFVQLVPLN